MKTLITAPSGPKIAVASWRPCRRELNQLKNIAPTQQTARKLPTAGPVF